METCLFCTFSTPHICCGEICCHIWARMLRPCFLEVFLGTGVVGSRMSPVVEVWVWQVPHFEVVWSRWETILGLWSFCIVEVLNGKFHVLDQILVRDRLIFFLVGRVLGKDPSRSYICIWICVYCIWCLSGNLCGSLGWGRSPRLCRRFMRWRYRNSRN